MLALMLTALGCVPVALRTPAPDAALTLLLPVTLIAGALGFAVYSPRVRRRWANAIMLALGPLALFVRIAGIGASLLKATGETVRLLCLLSLPSAGTDLSLRVLSSWLKAMNAFGAEAFGFAGRVSQWLINLTRATPSDDPAARAFCLAVALWLLASWASVRVRRHNDPLGGLLPATVLLSLALSQIAQDRWPLWLNLSALTLLLALANLSRLLEFWGRQHTDFADSIGEDSLLSAVLLGTLLLATAYAVSEFSLKDLLDRLREPERPAASAPVRSSSTSGPASGGVTTGVDRTLPDSHAITAGPKLSKDVVMLIRTGDLPPMQHAAELNVPHYNWRGITYQTYTGRGWSNPVATRVDVPAGAGLLIPSNESNRRLHGTVTIPSGLAGEAYWAGVLLESDVPLEISWRLPPATTTQNGDSDPLRGADMIGALIPSGLPASVQTYSFDSLLLDPTEQTLEAAPATYPKAITDRYLQLPDSVPERVRALGRDLTAQGQTPYERALAIESYLRRIPYSLDVPAPPTGRDAADYFLFDLKKGYCDYYATAMAVLARSAGLPARLVLGYASGSYDPYSAQYVVRKADAHAWTEIYFTGIGWVEFEPTANRPAPRREALHARPAEEAPQRSPSDSWNILPRAFHADPRIVWSFLAAVLFLYLCWLGIDGLRLARMAPDEAVTRLYARLRRSAGRITGIVPKEQTALEYAASLAERLADIGRHSRGVRWLAAPAIPAITALTDLYVRSLFAPDPIPQAESRRAVRTWAGLRWRLWIFNWMVPSRFFNRR